MIYLLAEPPTNRDYLRFGIARLEKTFQVVEVWDLGGILSSIKRNSSYELPSRVDKIESINQLRNKLKTISGSDELICIGVFSNVNSIRHLKTAYLILKSLGRISAVSFSSLPYEKDYFPILDGIGKWKHLKRKFKKHKIDGFVTRHLLTFINTLNQKCPGLIYLKKIDQIWYSTVFDDISTIFIGDNTYMKAIHHLDYDLAITEKKKVFARRGQIILIDSMGPAHPDYESRLYENVPNFEIWKTEVLNALDLIEFHTGKRIEIASHPSSNLDLCKETYGGRTSFLGQTCSLVRNSSLVIILEGSTAVNFAVIFRRPVLFIDSPIFDPRLRDLNFKFSSQLQMPFIRIDNPNLEFSIPVVKDSIYRKFQERYIKLPNTPEGYFWDTVASDYLNNLGGVQVN